MQTYLRLPGSLLVFHAPPFETFPLLKIFEKAAQRKGLLVNQVKTFHQRDGTPVYYIYEISHPGLDSYLQKGGFFWFREAEHWDDREGGNLDLKRGASLGKALGEFWGRQKTDFALYRFSIPRPISDAHLYVRYAFEGPPIRQYHLYLDGKLTASVALSSTGGYGYTEGEWRLYAIGIGGLARGDHELKIAPASGDQVVNLDYFYICAGECWLDSAATPR
jgi:hypothetical protein